MLEDHSKFFYINKCHYNVQQCNLNFYRLIDFQSLKPTPTDNTFNVMLIYYFKAINYNLVQIFKTQCIIYLLILLRDS